MPLEPADVYERVAESCHFPAERATVVEAVGDVEVAADDGASVSLESVLARTDESSFASARDLHHAVLANLGEEHVGRIDYDDRSSNPARDSQESF
ncbi:hypothetical protein EFA46_011515 (plasmid) [Halarchaeum sp. CBA1220]|uniref:DUF5789 family protein n=1 Tax=Halarchaeum sp. CBA1220 TaxID=1853682 RepID=UPI000F6AFA8E|nr:DUF5789 family protein [Halarchaeum sp. CBA1220]QLC34881.1 hypothetical protein EFA46_011515 [Halarchaeum sp. CBA1220]